MRKETSESKIKKIIKLFKDSFFYELMIEAVRAKVEAVKKELDTATLALLMVEVLKKKKKDPKETVFVQKIEETLIRREIQFFSDFPIDEPVEPVAWRAGKINQHGHVVCLVVRPEWVSSASRDNEGGELLYRELKTATRLIEGLKRRKDKVLNRQEIELVLGKQKKPVLN